MLCGLRSGKFFTLLVAFFLFIPDSLMKVIHVVVVCEHPVVCWFLFMVAPTVFWKLFLPIASVVCEVGMSWVKRFVEAFMRTVLPGPEKVGVRLGVWVRSVFRR